MRLQFVPAVVPWQRVRKDAIEIGALVLLYAVMGTLGLRLNAVSGFATLVWPCTGLALAALVRFGFRMWPGVFLGAVIVTLLAGGTIPVALGIAVGNTLEAAAGAAIMRRVSGIGAEHGGLQCALALILGAATCATLISAVVGVATLAAGGVVRSPHQAFVTFRAWWVGDILGALVVAPLLVAWWRKPEWRAAGARRRIEALVLIGLLTAACCGVFARSATPGHLVQSDYVLFPLFVWAALRFELRGASLAVAAVSVVAIWATVLGAGPFVRPELDRSLLALQAFMGCAAITSLVVAGVTMDRARAMRAQDTFVATLSHDLKNPLNALSLSAAVLRETEPTAAVDRHAGVVSRSVERMRRLITDLLDVAAIERGKLALEHRREDVRALVDEAVELLRPVAAARHVALTVEAGGPIEAMCDRERILQVLSNLLGNAIKFSPEQATVAALVERRDRSALVSIRDRGPGIARRDRRRVFERDWHAGAAAGGGTGLGLFIAKAIVEAHGGSIWVDSEPGAGSTFTFELPADGFTPARAGARARLPRVA